MKRLWMTALCLLLTMTVCARAKAFDSSAYSLQELIELRDAFSVLVANRIVQESSSLTPKEHRPLTIRFRGIEWNSSVTAVEQALKEKGIAKGTTVSDGVTQLSHPRDPGRTVWVNAYTVSAIEIGEWAAMGGYQPASIQLLCAHDEPGGTHENAVLKKVRISFEVSDPDLVYADLMNKLSALYGVCDQQESATRETPVFGADEPDVFEHHSASIWYAQDGSYVRLDMSYTLDPGTGEAVSPLLSLTYDKTEPAIFLFEEEDAEAAAAEAAERQLQQEHADDVSGL